MKTLGYYYRHARRKLISLILTVTTQAEAECGKLIKTFGVNKQRKGITSTLN